MKNLLKHRSIRGCRALLRFVRTLAVFFCVGFASAVTPGRADDGRCLISVDGRTFLNGLCNIRVRPGGSFTVGAGESYRSRYFASVTLESNQRTATGSWNGVDGESHAGYGLGLLKRKGACWINRRARICAWRLP